MTIYPKEIEIYVAEDGKVPFNVWLEGIVSPKTRQVIDARIARIRIGLMGDVNTIGEGVHEFRIDFGAGYRIYFANAGQTLILLLCGGDKSTQKKDAKLAKTYWADYQARKAKEIERK